MRLVYITPEVSGVGGLSRIIAIQANYFIENYHYEIDIILLDQKSDNTKIRYFINNRVKLHHLDIYNKGLLGYFNKIKRINKSLKDIKPDIVMVVFDDIFGLHLNRFITTNCPIIYQRHVTKNTNVLYGRKLVRSIKTFLNNKGGLGYDKFVVLTEEHKRDWPHLKNLYTISNPITIDANDKAKLEKKTVIAVGRHDVVKGFDLLLHSWQKVIFNNPDWKLKIYGKFSKRLNLEKIAQQLNINNTVEFHQHTTDIKSAYLESSILVCSSRIEAFSLVIAEAMSLGLPAVSFDCPYGPRAIIKHGVDGLLVKPNDTEKLAEALMTLIENKNLRKQMGERAQENIQRYSPDKIMQKWKLLFESLVQE
ncbi:glycosyltransferase family 4 protein [Winogradskyella alexanderae]|uniref:Glycosyltransferase family 4 protein n=1 Tax=Winogradskyella alexanderae TaxID=2877123 RepID=A0ABS7XTZ3_9FLAO|nr:glycosyltransferase family 4 protein [Winogradskyella alexanderae]MCA0133495.1 glycosyltransferase family 4 protein [Winogradskyella alexanderae]